MSTKWLRHVPTGEMYQWDPVFAARGDFEEVGVPKDEAESDGVAPTEPRKRGRKKSAIQVEDAVDEFLSSD